MQINLLLGSLINEQFDIFISFLVQELHANSDT